MTPEEVVAFYQCMSHRTLQRTFKDCVLRGNGIMAMAVINMAMTPAVSAFLTDSIDQVLQKNDIPLHGQRTMCVGPVVARMIVPYEWYDPLTFERQVTSMDWMFVLQHRLVVDDCEVLREP